MKTSRKDRWSAYRQAELEFLSAGEIRIRIRDLYANLRAGRLAERTIKDRDLECLARLHEFAGARNYEQPMKQAWSGTYLAWAAKTADALWVARYRDLLEKSFALRFPDSRPGAKAFGEFIGQLRPGSIMRHFPMPKDRSNPLDPVAWEIGFAAGQATEALGKRFSTPEFSQAKLDQVEEIRRLALEAARRWRSNPENQGRKCPKAHEIIANLPHVKHTPRKNDTRKATLRWKGPHAGKITVGRFSNLWTKWKREPDFRAALKAPAPK